MGRAFAPELMPLEEKVFGTVKARRLFRQGDKVLVGFSGGPDSSALLEVLTRLNDRLDLKIHLFHLDHTMRFGSEQDAMAVKATAERYALPITVEKADVPGFARRERLSPEDAARRVRYDMLARAAAESGSDRIAVGHHQDDNVETLLMNLIRGTGGRGLRSIPPVRGKVVRPLIDVSRQEILEYCWVRRLKTIEDPSNEDPQYLRNRIRAELIPALEDLNPAIRETLLRAIEISGEDDGCLEKIAGDRFKRIIQLDEGMAVVDIRKLARQPLALRRRLIRRAIEHVIGTLDGVQFKHVDRILQVKPGPGSKVVLEDLKGLRVLREYDRLLFARASTMSRVNLAKIPLKVPGVTQLDRVGLKIRAEVKPAEKIRRSLPDLGRDVALLDAATLKHPLSLRVPLPGDRFRPLGMAGEKKVHDFFVDEKVPARVRGRSFIVTSGERIVWLVGYRIDDRFKLTGESSRAVVLTAEHGE